MVPLFNPSGLVINNFITELWIPLGAYVRTDGHQLQIFLSQVCNSWIQKTHRLEGHLSNTRYDPKFSQGHFYDLG